MASESPNTTGDSPLPAASAVFIPPSVSRASLLTAASTSHFSPVPAALQPTDPSDPSTAPACCLGVDEAGRGPSIGPMVYGVFYLPLALSDPLLRTAHGFDDSKVLKPAVRTALMRTVCTPGTDLYDSCGWATRSLSARDIGAGMLRAPTSYNLNAQAMDATVELVRGVMARGVNVREVYVDTVGRPDLYQAKLQRVFPGTKITVASKADSLYPCVSAASVCAKVTRDVALEVLYELASGGRERPANGGDGEEEAEAEANSGDEGLPWGSGYPSDARCVNWLKGNMHPVFGWGPECRQSWAPLINLLETKGTAVPVEWPDLKDTDNHKLSDYFSSGAKDNDDEPDELGAWFGKSVGLEAF